MTQIFIHGDSNESTLVAVIVPNDVEFEKINKDKDQLMKIINQQAKDNDKLKGFEMVRAVHIETDPFSVSALFNPLVTTTAKMPQNWHYKPMNWTTHDIMLVRD